MMPDTNGANFVKMQQESLTRLVGSEVAKYKGVGFYE